jgi:hypothetical protein
MLLSDRGCCPVVIGMWRQLSQSCSSHTIVSASVSTSTLCAEPAAEVHAGQVALSGLAARPQPRFIVLWATTTSIIAFIKQGPHYFTR